ncbi:zinc finger protein 676-like [Vanessa cardui]|uniref:zinc finger protein 676-like n=1 Tax=Vanessa cardui TaxID=171605 RepID=UPI001F137A2E|nr:zinc finger protein 676-like [Vanessa cardui]
MSGKLIVHRFETEDKFQTLQILIEENDKTTIETWREGQDYPKKKEKDKPRLTVKVVSEDNSSNIDLDSCAEKVEETGKFLNNLQVQLKIQHLSGETNNDSKSETKSTIFNRNTEVLTKHYRTPDTEENAHKVPAETYSFSNKDIGSLMSPLEYSLEKVKENNARIMENIHMLNRTLNYTKKKEILGIINPKPLRSYPCEECGKCFVYETGLWRHYSVRHGSLDKHQRWQFVWTCTECFQVWPRQDLAQKHANLCCKSDNTDCVREIKTSSLLQCEFCEKVYTSIPRLLRHLKMHTVTKNYECNACNIAFSCYKTAEQHWVICLWLKMYYQFSLPKLLLCNACDRKFRNYDQLYNHRYKVGHFIPKSSDNGENNCVFIPSLVFQCEICGQWFNSISQIQDHRNQYHPHFNSGILYNTEIPVTSEA